MKNLTLSEMELQIVGGNIVDGFCVGIGSASVLYTVGALTQWWNPIGLVSWGFIGADAACLAYEASQLK